MNEQQLAELKLLKQSYPFRIIYGALKDGEFKTGAVVTMHRPNRLVRQGWQVWRLS